MRMRILVSDRHRSPSVRSTNVYEERSLGIYHDDASESMNEEIFSSGDRMSVWGNYLAMHARKQLAFGMSVFMTVIGFSSYHTRLDMWWLGLALFLVCIIEVCCSPSIFSLGLTLALSA